MEGDLTPSSPKKQQQIKPRMHEKQLVYLVQHWSARDRLWAVGLVEYDNVKMLSCTELFRLTWCWCSSSDSRNKIHDDTSPSRGPVMGENISYRNTRCIGNIPRFVWQISASESILSSTYCIYTYLTYKCHLYIEMHFFTTISHCWVVSLFIYLSNAQCAKPL